MPSYPRGLITDEIRGAYQIRITLKWYRPFFPCRGEFCRFQNLSGTYLKADAVQHY